MGLRLSQRGPQQSTAWRCSSTTRVISPDAQFLNPNPGSPASQGKRTMIVMTQDFRFSLGQLELFPGDQKHIAALASSCVSASTKNAPQGRQNFMSATSAI